MARTKLRKFKLIPLLIGAIILVVTIGIMLKLRPPMSPPQRISAEETYSLQGGTCVKDVNGLYNSFEDCFRAAESTANLTADNCLGYKNYTLCLSNPPEGDIKDIIDGSVHYVKLTYPEIPSKENDPNKYWMCLKTDPKDCDDDDLKEITATNGTITIERLCGDGHNKLKTSCDDDGSDYFHQEKTYRATFFGKKKVDSPHLGSASFYINHFYPKVKAPQPSGQNYAFSVDSIVKNHNNTMQVSIQGRNKTHGKNQDKYNDYWVQLVGVDNDYRSDSGCVFVPDGGSEATGTIALKLPPTYDDPSENIVAKLGGGRYILRIVDGIDLRDNNTMCSEGDFTYFHVPIEIGAGGTAGKVGVPIPDPYNKEQGFFAPKITPEPLCDEEDKLEGTDYCRRIKTGLGIKISTEPSAFVTDVFTLVLSIGGIAVVVFLIQAGYRLMTSAGNKEKVGAAREQITAAIMGLIFIILSVTILEFIGIDVLHLPGFGR